MKRHLIEDLKFRQKVNLESTESINEMLENLEKKVSIYVPDTHKKSLFLIKFIENIHRIYGYCYIIILFALKVYYLF